VVDVVVVGVVSLLAGAEQQHFVLRQVVAVVVYVLEDY
jgi:hypothetical protein